MDDIKPFFTADKREFSKSDKYAMVDYSTSFKDTPYECSSDLTTKIANPPKMHINHSMCMWSDLLGFGSIFYDNKWKLTKKQYNQIYARLRAAHSCALYHSSSNERNLILNDGIAKVLPIHSSIFNKNIISTIGFFMRSCVMLHMAINQSERNNPITYPGCRSVIAFGDNVEYLAEEVRSDDYIFNYTKPKDKTKIRSRENPIVVYNPKELQMNTAFSKAYILESGGSRSGLPGNNLYVDESVIEAIYTYSKQKKYEPVWTKRDGLNCLFVPYEKGKLDRVVLGLAFDEDPIIPSECKFDTKVYRLIRFYPFDEDTNEFYFDVNSDLFD